MTARQLRGRTLENSRAAELSEMQAYRDLASHSGQTPCPIDLHVAPIGSGIALQSRLSGRSVVLNRVLGWGMDRPARQSELDSAAKAYTAIGKPWGVELSPCAEPPEITDWLRTHRARRALATAVWCFACDTAPLPKTLRLDKSLHVRPWTPSDGAGWTELLTRVFGVDPRVGELLATLPRSPAWRCWLAMHGHQVAGAGLLFLGEAGLGWVGWGATHPDYRGLGLHKAIMVARLLDAADHGCRLVTSETAVGTAARPVPSYRNLERLSFKSVHVRHTHIAMPSHSNKLSP